MSERCKLISRKAGRQVPSSCCSEDGQVGARLQSGAWPRVRWQQRDEVLQWQRVRHQLGCPQEVNQAEYGERGVLGERGGARRVGRAPVLQYTGPNPILTPLTQRLHRLHACCRNQVRSASHCHSAVLSELSLTSDSDWGAVAVLRPV